MIVLTAILLRHHKADLQLILLLFPRNVQDISDVPMQQSVEHALLVQWLQIQMEYIQIGYIHFQRLPGKLLRLVTQDGEALKL